METARAQAHIQVRDQQQATWNKFSAGWGKWDELVLSWLGPVGDALLDAASLTPTSHLLDVASGTGEPGLTAAARIPRGKVTITDLAEKMLRVAEENAARRGIRNIETRQCDAGELPFADATFDAVTARFGFMFFPDVLGAARELARVARPGARVTAAVWGVPEKNPWATTIMGTIASYVNLPTQPPGAPGLFRCATPGYMTGVFREAGLRNVTETEVKIPERFDDAEQYFTFMNDAAAPVVAGMALADEPTRARIKDAVLGAVNGDGQSKSGKLHLDAVAVVITGEK
ncbi:MAG TPA: methyltransferase domain-containing protein [Polyangia bacterium]|nr:methyltransferase domain-containing protein [Polyangia bacterium]